ncbi:transmembrane protein 70 homolog, mitochondrial-like [Macrobrachium nipponense]|uniref:transmembrane protein 70 homolog, mitochondrial-like n=1 Tax=Macrobrachium nipponense TaxID=159736 RepID=UPI0030C8D3D4
MAQIGSLHRALHMQRCTGVVLLRSSVASFSTHSPVPQLLQIGTVKTQQHRCYCSDSNKSKSQNIKAQENVDIGPGTWKEVYHGILTTQIRMVKVFSLSTSFIGLSMQPLLFQKVVGTGAGLAIAAGSFIGFFTFVTPFLIHWITKKYVTRLEYDPKHDIYSATTLTFFLRERKINFKVDDVQVPTVPGIFTTFHVKNQPLFVEPRMFEDIEHYGRIMGYDKPIDFSPDEDDKEHK